jgi:predicted enzyme related to lactoylglutathione lyase
MPRVIHFEFAADNPERAAKFYREVSAGSLPNGAAQWTTGW